MNRHPKGRETGNDSCVCRREGDYWTFAFDGTIVRIRDTRGIRYLSALLRQPGAEVHVLSIVKIGEVPSVVRAGAPRSVDALAERARISVTKGLGGAIDRLEAMHPVLGAHLRATIRRGYYCSYRPDPRLMTVWRS